MTRALASYCGLLRVVTLTCYLLWWTLSRAMEGRTRSRKPAK